MRLHGNYPRDIVPPRSTYYDSGRFGRMFGSLPPFAPDTPAVREALLEIGQAGGIMDANDDLTAAPAALIVDRAHSAENPDNPRTTAGMTFLGQFIDHDVTFDPTSTLERQVDPEHVANFRTPTLALDNVYGAGPGAAPHLYDRHAAGPGARFLVEESGTDGRHDLPRNGQGRALIGDPRNDENLIVSQLHLGFLLFHNRVCDHLAELGGITGDPFAEAQRVVRWHYQWIVLHEFLPAICGERVVADVLEHGRRFYGWRHEPFIPVEFSVAAYRFGHSQVRPSYRANFGRDGGPAFFGLLFDPAADASARDPDDLRGSCRSPRRFVDWPTFFNFGDAQVRPSKRIDTTLSSILFQLPDTVVALPDARANPASLAQRNLLRHLTFALPSGQRVARAMRLPVLAPGDLADLESVGLHESTPLWFYILREAELQERGLRLGAVGARIVAEVLIGLMEGDRTSFLSQDPAWTPFLPTFEPSEQGRGFGMVDLLSFAGVGV